VLGFQGGVTLTPASLIAVSAGFGIDPQSSQRVSTWLVFTPQVAIGLRTPALQFESDPSGTRAYFGANVGREWLVTGPWGVSFKGAAFVEPTVHVILADGPGDQEWGAKFGWRMYQAGGAYKQRAVFEVTRSF
jgi:hypothetical protein